MKPTLSSLRKALEGWPGLAAHIVLFLGVSYALGLMTRDNMEPWYNGLAKPPFTAPDWAFPVVWPLLYILLAFVLWRLLARGDIAALKLGWGHMLLNWAWTPVFFGYHEIFGALLWLAAMLATLARTRSLIPPEDRLSRGLLLPYAAWLCFAAYMTAGIWILN